jgi:hypothetical protein
MYAGSPTAAPLIPDEMPRALWAAATAVPDAPDFDFYFGMLLMPVPSRRCYLRAPDPGERICTFGVALQDSCPPARRRPRSLIPLPLPFWPRAPCALPCSMSTSAVLKSREEWVAMACGIGEEKEAAMATGSRLGGETGAREQRIGRETGEGTQGCLHHFHAPLFFALELFLCLGGVWIPLVP